MTVTVRIPTVLRRLAGNQDEIEARGETVRAVLADIGERHPQLLERICEEGELRAFLNAFVEGEDVRFADGLDTRVAEGDEISIIPSIAGG